MTKCEIIYDAGADCALVCVIHGEMGITHICKHQLSELEAELAVEKGAKNYAQNHLQEAEDESELWKARAEKAEDTIAQLLVEGNKWMLRYQGADIDRRKAEVGCVVCGYSLES